MNITTKQELKEKIKERVAFYRNQKGFDFINEKDLEGYEDSMQTWISWYFDDENKKVNWSDWDVIIRELKKESY